MAERTDIEWCDHTFNPWVGCTKISPACDHCYAEVWARRTGRPELWQGERRRTTVDYWRQPLKWDRAAAAAGVRRRVFCASLADVFDNQVVAIWREDLWTLIYVTPHLDWLLLTKRPQNIAKMLPRDWGNGWPNVWLGTTAEDAVHYCQRWAHVAAIPARVRFLSYEPALSDIGDLDLGRVGAPNWVIAGGESGPHARPTHPDWVRSLRDQCGAAGVPFFFKQWGEWKDGSDFATDAMAVLSDGRVVEPTQPSLLAAARVGPVGNPTMMRRVGKKRAGALLDGREHREFPRA